VTKWSRTNGPCDPEFFSKPGLVEILHAIRVETQLLEPGDTPITIVPPPVNADHRYPRLHFKGTGMTVPGVQEDTVVDGHVDRYLNGTIQWSFVSLVLGLQPTVGADQVMQVSRYANIVWMSAIATPSVFSG